MKKIVIGCDNAAVDLKQTIIAFLKAKGYEVENIGCDSTLDNTYYPYIAEKVCNKIMESNYEKEGILICGTGIGMAMTANKFPGIRAAVCHDNYSAERAKLSNDANVLCMGARIIGPELAKKVTAEWLSLEFADGNSTPKVNAIRELEERNMAAFSKV